MTDFDGLTQVLHELPVNSAQAEINEFTNQMKDCSFSEQVELYKLLIDKFPKNLPVLLDYYHLLDSRGNIKGIRLEKLRLLEKIHQAQEYKGWSFAEAAESGDPCAELLRRDIIHKFNLSGVNLTPEECSLAKKIVLDYCGSGGPVILDDFYTLKTLAFTKKDLQDLLDLVNERRQHFRWFVAGLESNLDSAKQNENQGFLRCHICGNFTIEKEGGVCKKCHAEY
jgi:hypothetical protein